MDIYILLAFTAGLFLSVQIGVNACVASSIQNSVVAALISFLVGTFGLIIYTLASKQVLILPMSSLQNIPWWGWAGGLLGACYVTLAIICAPQIGATQLVGIVVTGQLLTSLVLDHFGLIGFEVNEINIYRIIGAVFLIAGVWFIRKV